MRKAHMFPAKPLHPLINPASKHYDDNENDKTCLEIMEEEMTVVEMMGACKFNLKKYRCRRGKKDDVTLEDSKIKTYEDYYDELYKLARSIGWTRASDISVHFGWIIVKKEWRYR